ncbi:MAG: acylphosphatase [Candidatus Daviesbacteria bacterium]|nr:acylphosphatase [Candidatus Daviesbacteria bacterium]
MKKHLNIKIYGIVQGIFFRATAKEKADQLGIKGFAKNQPDGSVLIEAEGKKKNLDEFVKWCHIGPPLARVEKVVVIEGKLKNFPQFTVN